MERYIGLDAHKESCTLAVMGPSGRKLSSHVVQTDPLALQQAIAAIKGKRHLCLEEGALSEWLFELFDPLVGECVVVQPEKKNGRKSDLTDAWERAEDIRVGRAKRVIYKSTGRFSELRQAVWTYHSLQRDVVRSKLQLKALFHGRAVTGMGNSLYLESKRKPWVDTLPAHHQRRAWLLAEKLDRNMETFAEAESWLNRAAKKIPIVKRLMTVPGIGEVRAATIAAVVVTPFRFKRAGYWSYCGFGIVTRDSAEWKKDQHTGQWKRRQAQLTRGLNRNRNPKLKDVYKGAANTIIMLQPDVPLYHSYMRTLEHTKPDLAKLTLARKIAATTLAMWKRQEDYNPERYKRR